MKSLLLASLLAVAPWPARCPVAAGEVRIAAVGYGRPMFSPAPPAWTQPFANFQQWMRTPEGMQATASLAPSLTYLRTIDLSQPAGAIAIAPLSERLPQSAQALLAAPQGLGAEERAALIASVLQARQDAAPEVERRTAAAVADLNAAGEYADAAQTLALQQQLKGLTLYGAPVGIRYKAVRRMAAERAMADAQAAGSRLLAGWRTPQPLPAQDPAAAPDWSAAQDPKKIRIPLALPPPRFTDSKHWSEDLVPDRSYGERLSAAANLFSDADKAQSPAESSALEAKGALLQTLRDKDPKTYSHMMRVGLMAGLIAWKMGLPMPFAIKTAWGARLHDMGKREEPILTVINKEGKLTPEERVIMERHTQEGSRIVAQAPGLDLVSRRTAGKVALTHHETVDGKGYPQALRADEIPLESRITNLADYYDALMENRPYRKGMTTAEALAIMEGQRHKFDPAAWKAFRALLDEDLASARK
ncbi:MAG: HD domain-containing phosphohydrolase [Elusimicrobiota bacterium]